MTSGSSIYSILQYADTRQQHGTNKTRTWVRHNVKRHTPLCPATAESTQLSELNSIFIFIIYNHDRSTSSPPQSQRYHHLLRSEHPWGPVSPRVHRTTSSRVLLLRDRSSEHCSYNHRNERSEGRDHARRPRRRTWNWRGGQLPPGTGRCRLLNRVGKARSR